jgi:hypothetical protein
MTSMPARHEWSGSMAPVSEAPGQASIVFGARAPAPESHQVRSSVHINDPEHSTI